MCDQIEIARLALGTLDVDYRPDISREELLREVGSYDALVVRSRTKVDKEVIEKGSRLKLIARPGTGLDNIDVESAKSRGIQVVNSPESLVEAVAEHVLLLMLAVSRRLVESANSTKSGRWEKNALTGTELKGKTLGIVGLGRIGRRIGEIARVMGMSIVVYDVIPLAPEVLAEIGAKVVDLDSLFTSSDFVTLHVPLTESTKGLVDTRRLSLMKKESVVINTSRGGVVDENALSTALAEGRIRGAGLDVFAQEPPVGRILSATNAILTPHIGGQTVEAQYDAVTIIGEKVRTFFSGA